MNRRSFIESILIGGIAPMILPGAGRIWKPTGKIRKGITPWRINPVWLAIEKRAQELGIVSWKCAWTLHNGVWCPCGTVVPSPQDWFTGLRPIPVRLSPEMVNFQIIRRPAE